MYVKLGELIVNTTADYNGEIIKVLEENNFIVVKAMDTIYEARYSIAKAEQEET